MKRTVLIVLLLALCWGCKRESEKIFCDKGYTWEFVIKNETGNKVVNISTDYEYGTGYLKHFALETGLSQPVSAYWDLGPCYRKTPLISIFDDDFYVNPMSWPIYGENQYFTMTIDGEVVSDDIWRLEHWTFEPDPTDFYHATYTLTITNELLTSLAPSGRW